MAGGAPGLNEPLHGVGWHVKVFPRRIRPLKMDRLLRTCCGAVHTRDAVLFILKYRPITSHDTHIHRAGGGAQAALDTGFFINQ
jgi:hypothetical protein